MNILAHRGLWANTPEDKNTLKAFRKAVDNGYGIETDVRDCDGRLVISHDMPTADNVILFKDFLCEFGDKFNSNQLLAINIKSDGLASVLLDEISSAGISSDSYFTFDMSVPDMMSYQKLNIPFYVRVSELEKVNPFIEYSHGVWLDELTQSWVTRKEVNLIAAQGKPICFVSRELHGREYNDYWSFIIEYDCDKILICTDYPKQFEKNLFVKSD